MPADVTIQLDGDLSPVEEKLAALAETGAAAGEQLGESLGAAADDGAAKLVEAIDSIAEAAEQLSGEPIIDPSNEKAVAAFSKELAKAAAEVAKVQKAVDGLGAKAFEGSVKGAEQLAQKAEKAGGSLKKLVDQARAAGAGGNGLERLSTQAEKLLNTSTRLNAVGFAKKLETDAKAAAGGLDKAEKAAAALSKQLEKEKAAELKKAEQEAAKLAASEAKAAAEAERLNAALQKEKAAQIAAAQKALDQMAATLEKDRAAAEKFLRTLEGLDAPAPQKLAANIRKLDDDLKKASADFAKLAEQGKKTGQVTPELQKAADRVRTLADRVKETAAQFPPLGQRGQAALEQIRRNADQAAAAVAKVKAPQNLAADLDQAKAAVAGLAGGFAALAGAFALDQLRSFIGLLVQLGQESLNLAAKRESLVAFFDGVVDGAGGGAEALQQISEIGARWGIQVEGLRGIYGEFLAATDKLGISLEQQKTLFEALAVGFNTLGAEGPALAEVLRQIDAGVLKGTFSWEQLIEISKKYPAVLDILAERFGTTEAGLQRIASQGGILASRVLPELAKGFNQALGQDAEKRAAGIGAELARLSNTVLELKENFGGALTPEVLSVIDAFRGLDEGRSVIDGIVGALGPLFSTLRAVGDLLNGDVQTGAREFGSALLQVVESIPILETLRQQFVNLVRAIEIGFATILDLPARFSAEIAKIRDAFVRGDISKALQNTSAELRDSAKAAREAAQGTSEAAGASKTLGEELDKIPPLASTAGLAIAKAGSDGAKALDEAAAAAARAGAALRDNLNRQQTPSGAPPGPSPQVSSGQRDPAAERLALLAGDYKSLQDLTAQPLDIKVDTGGLQAAGAAAAQLEDILQRAAAGLTSGELAAGAASNLTAPAEILPQEQARAADALLRQLLADSGTLKGALAELGDAARNNVAAALQELARGAQAGQLDVQTLREQVDSLTRNLASGGPAAQAFGRELGAALAPPKKEDLAAQLADIVKASAGVQAAGAATAASQTQAAGAIGSAGAAAQTTAAGYVTLGQGLQAIIPTSQEAAAAQAQAAAQLEALGGRVGQATGGVVAFGGEVAKIPSQLEAAAGSVGQIGPALQDAAKSAQASGQAIAGANATAASSSAAAGQAAQASGQAAASAGAGYVELGNAQQQAIPLADGVAEAQARAAAELEAAGGRVGQATAGYIEFAGQVAKIPNELEAAAGSVGQIGPALEETGEKAKTAGEGVAIGTAEFGRAAERVGLLDNAAGPLAEKLEHISEVAQQQGPLQEFGDVVGQVGNQAQAAAPGIEALSGPLDRIGAAIQRLTGVDPGQVLQSLGVQAQAAAEPLAAAAQPAGQLAEAVGQVSAAAGAGDNLQAFASAAEAAVDPVTTAAEPAARLAEGISAIAEKGAAAGPALEGVTEALADSEAGLTAGAQSFEKLASSLTSAKEQLSGLGADLAAVVQAAEEGAPALEALATAEGTAAEQAARLNSELSRTADAITRVGPAAAAAKKSLVDLGGPDVIQALERLGSKLDDIRNRANAAAEAIERMNEKLRDTADAQEGL